MHRPIITLTTDFGLRDPYVAEMKAVILDINPNATIIDISHEVEKFNIKMGAYILASAAPYFPKGTIHVAVVDPGVGTERRPIIIEAKNSFFAGPDNGLMVLAAKSQGIKRIYEISNRKFMRHEISSTFHGRDIFAPAAAHLSKGVSPQEIGPEVKDIVVPEFAQVIKRGNMLVGEVLYIDGFGNIVTNFTVRELEQLKGKDALQIGLRGLKLNVKLCKAYGDVKPQEPLAIIGSHNFLELSLNQGDAAKTFKTKVGDKITLHL
ncbi:MAG: S-adenosyl-l-methionine hydroxide adenosyltransferase family protein [Candidatus Bathyarchaeia archaeon]